MKSGGESRRFVGARVQREVQQDDARCLPASGVREAYDSLERWRNDGSVSQRSNRDLFAPIEQHERRPVVEDSRTFRIVRCYRARTPVPDVGVQHPPTLVTAKAFSSTYEGQLLQSDHL